MKTSSLWKTLLDRGICCGTCKYWIDDGGAPNVGKCRDDAICGQHPIIDGVEDGWFYAYCECHNGLKVTLETERSFCCCHWEKRVGNEGISLTRRRSLERKAK